jgi:hypothetical protein
MTSAVNVGIESVARMHLKDGSVVEHPCRFSAEEWDLLSTFATYAEELSGTALLSNHWTFRYKVTSGVDGVEVDTSGFPDPDQFRALLLLMRPFVLQEEPTAFGKTKNLLKRRLDHPKLRDYLDRLAHDFSGETQAMYLVSEGKRLNSPDMLKLWLNAFEYHRDPNKRLEWESLHDEHVMPTAFTKAYYISMMLDSAVAVMRLSDVIHSLGHHRKDGPSS